MEISQRIFNLETETAFSILAEATKLQSEGKDIINLGIGQPDFKTPQNIVEAGIKALRDGHHGYTPSNGILELREAVTERISNTHNIDIDPNCVLITPGGKPTIFFSILMFGENGSEIIYPDPGFPIYRSMIKFTGAKPISMDLNEKNNFEIDLDNLSSLINEKTRLIIINNPNNPTGAFMKKSKIDNLINLLEKFPKIVILSDEIYSKIIFDNHKMPTFLNYESIKNRLIVLDGWSKTFCMTGWRLGWSIWPKKLIEHANKLCVNDHSCPSAVSQYAGLEALKGSDKEITIMVNEFEKRRDLIYSELNNLKNISCFRPGGAFYSFPNISKTGLNGQEFSKKALYEMNVAVVPGNSFGKNGNEFVRISYANSTKNIKKAIQRLANI